MYGYDSGGVHIIAQDDGERLGGQESRSVQKGIRCRSLQTRVVGGWVGGG